MLQSVPLPLTTPLRDAVLPIRPSKLTFSSASLSSNEHPVFQWTSNERPVFHSLVQWTASIPMNVQYSTPSSSIVVVCSPGHVIVLCTSDELGCSGSAVQTIQPDHVIKSNQSEALLRSRDLRPANQRLYCRHVITVVSGWSVCFGVWSLSAKFSCILLRLGQLPWTYKLYTTSFMRASQLTSYDGL